MLAQVANQAKYYRVISASLELLDQHVLATSNTTRPLTNVTHVHLVSFQVTTNLVHKMEDAKLLNKIAMQMAKSNLDNNNAMP